MTHIPIRRHAPLSLYCALILVVAQVSAATVRAQSGPGDSDGDRPNDRPNDRMGDEPLPQAVPAAVVGVPVEGTDASAGGTTRTLEDRTDSPSPVSETVSPPPPRTPPYSLPFFLRPMPALNVVRLDTVLAPHDRVGVNPTTMAARSGLELDVVQLATVGVRFADWAQGIVRMGWDWTSDPGALGLSNLLLAGNFTWKIESVFRLSIFTAVSLPTGTDANATLNHRNARMARLAMDNAMFLVDHLAGIVGGSFAYVDHGLTVQIDATVLGFGRVEGTADDAIVNSTFGLLASYFVVPEFSVGGEVHHQHFLSDPVAVVANPEQRSQTTGTVGFRVHLQPVRGVWVRPAVSWSVGFDPPLSTDAWQMCQVDIPVFF